MAEHLDPKETTDRTDAKLSAKYKDLYVRTMTNTEILYASAVKAVVCDNCDEPCRVHAAETKLPLCTVCFATLQESIRRASKLGFHLGMGGR